MRPTDMIRYGIWAGIVATAEANRRHYRMTTTWVPHLLANTVALLLPDLGRVLIRGEQGPGAGERRLLSAEVRHMIHETFAAVVRDNPRYVAYVTPLAMGYLLSHPRFNIYKGELAEKRLVGFGLDALPHAATAFALTALVGDTARVAARCAPGASVLSRAIGWTDRHQALMSASLLLLVTIVWEVGEYFMHRYEMAERGDAREINMQWSVDDTVYDCIANLIGWGLASMWQGGEIRSPARGGEQYYTRA